MATISEDIAGANNSINSMNQLMIDLQKQMDGMLAYQESINTAISIPNIVAAPNTDIFYLYSEQSVVNVAAANGGIIFPSGTTEQRPAKPQAGTVRFNTNSSSLEIYTTSWQDVGTGVGGGSSSGPMFNGLYFQNESTINVGFQMANNRNYMSIGPIVHTNGEISVIDAMWKIV